MEKKIFNFKDRLRELRTEAGISKQELSKAINFGVSIIYYWENGDREPTSKALLALSEYFHVSTDYLLGREDDFGNVQISNNQKLSYKEEKLLTAFALLDQDEQDKIIEDCIYFANRNTKKLNKESINDNKSNCSKW